MYGQNTHLNEAMHRTRYVRTLLNLRTKNGSRFGNMQQFSPVLRSVRKRKPIFVTGIISLVCPS